MADPDRSKGLARLREREAIRQTEQIESVSGGENRRAAL
jgi:ABC-type iron transport system FetAB ATPase subunit